MKLTSNLFRKAISERKPQLGLWCSLPEPTAVEICAGAGFDWLLLDAEHTPNDVRSLLTALQVVAPYDVHPVIRPPVGDAATIKRLLDIGAQTLLIPMVETAEQAAALVQATRYPPNGIRGVSAQTRAGRWGRIPDYFRRADSEICLLLQVETRQALENIDAISAIEGVDGVFIGPSDLAASLGYIGKPEHAEVQAAIDGAFAAITAAGKPAGILTPDEAFALKYLDRGFSFVAVGADTALLAQATSGLRARFEGVVAQKS